jgi:putative transcriptional regulator
MAKTANKTESGILGTVHKTAAGLHRAGLIDRATMREFDALCMAPVWPEAIRALRERE